MKLLTLLLATLCLLAAAAAAQTVKAVSFNTTNDTVVSTNRIIFPLLGTAGGTAATPSLTLASGTNTFGLFAATVFGTGPYLGFSVDGTRRFLIATNTIRAEQPISFSTTNIAAETRTNLGLGAAWLTNTDDTNFRSAIGLGATNDVSFNSVAVTNAATTRTNLGLGSGITTNITFVDVATNTNSVTISNGIITGWTQ